MTELTKKANELALRAYVKADCMKDRAKSELSELANNETGVSGMVVSIILIAIAITLGIIFRKRIIELVNIIFDSADEEFKDPSNTSV